MKAILTLMLTLFLGSELFATAQVPDRIIYQGTAYKLHSNPLEAYFKKYPDKRPQSDFTSTGLWRGYVATFEITDGQLFLKDIEVRYRDTGWKSVIADVFPGQENIKVEWLTGILVMPHGKVVNYVHMGYGTSYENYILLEIDKGDFKREKRFSHKTYEKFKEKQFQAFKGTDEYKTAKARLLKRGTSEKFIDSFLRSYVTEYTSKILTE